MMLRMTNKMTRDAAMFTALAAVCVVAIIGCTAAQPADETGMDSADIYLKELQTSPELRIKDLPMPAGYKYKGDKSAIVEYGDVQAGNLIYEGPDDAAALVDYFRREMPRYDWTLVSMIERQDIRMVFEKPSRICEITVRPQSGLTRRTEIAVYYAPKAHE